MEINYKDYGNHLILSINRDALRLYEVHYGRPSSLFSVLQEVICRNRNLCLCSKDFYHRVLEIPVSLWSYFVLSRYAEVWQREQT
jgi:hypothetical protein